MAPASAGPIQHGYKLGRDTRFLTDPDAKLSGGDPVAVLKPGQDVPDIQPRNRRYPMWAFTSSMSSAAGSILGVNGDFGTPTGQPTHTMMIDGELWTSGQSGGHDVAWSAKGDRAYVGHPASKVARHRRGGRCELLRARLERRGKPPAGVSAGTRRVAAW